MKGNRKTKYIEQKAAIDNVIWAKENHMDVVEALECTISADVAPVVHGRWYYAGAYARCSACNELTLSPTIHRFQTFRYCPNCDAKMV